MNLHHGAHVVATKAYTLKTLSIRTDAFIVVTCGTKRLHKPGVSLQIRAGQGVVIAHGTQWDVTNDPDGRAEYQALALAFPDPILREFNTLEGASDIPMVSAASVFGVDEEIFVAMQRTLPPTGNRPMSKQLLHHRIMEVLLLLAQRGHRFASVEEITWPEKVRRLVAQRPHAKWNVESLSTAFHMSESTLRRRLEGSATTLAALVREVRLEVALGLLQTSRLSVGDVAQHCGWQSHSRFTSAFQERWGVAPSVVRARLKEDAQDLTESD